MQMKQMDIQIDKAERAWSKWDTDTLKRMGILNSRMVQELEEDWDSIE